MDNLEKLKSHASVINSLLSKYIKLHNTFQKSTSSVFSIFKRINYTNMAGDAYFLFEQLRDERNEIEKLKLDSSNPKEKEFGEGLFQYSKSLTETVHLLFMLLNALKEKAEGGELSMIEHMDNNKKYQQSIEDYVTRGKELNEIYKSLL